MLHKNRVYPIGALLLFWLLLPALVFAQLTIKVVAVPANTPQGANIYIAGTFNNWNPSDPTKILTSLGGGQYQIVLNPPVGTVEFKFTRGGWPTVEGDANGNQLPNRTTTYNGQPKTVELTILSWEDLPSGTTAAANVTLLDDDFYMPQLNKNRKIWIYLPPDYQTSTKHYPVLYMQDAQNLFDDYTSFSGEWEVDESLNELFTQGDYGCIVVGIENGGADRLDEYSPWVNSEYNEGGDGAAYVEFMVNTLKPYVDEHYRTLPGRNTTGVMGSSMGGLISMYALAERQDVFAKAGIFSSAFWFGGDGPVNNVLANPKEGDVRVYFLAGADEEGDGNQSNYVVEDMQAVANAMSTAGFGPNEKQVVIKNDGQHAEWFWAREFPDAYIWLFQNSVATSGPAQNTTFKVFPNPAGDWVRLSGFDNEAKVRIQILGADGKLWRDTTVSAGEAIWTGDLPAGAFVVKAKSKGKAWKTAKLLLN